MYFSNHKDDNLIRCKKCNKLAVDCLEDERYKFVVIHPKDGDKYWLCGNCNKARKIFNDHNRSQDLQMIITADKVYTKGEFVNDSIG
jgi:uncharacterized C2H2 Zn-finger protein